MDEQTVLDAFLARVADDPDAIAVVDGDRALRYRQIRDAADAVCARLKDAGVRPGDVVAVAAPRCAELAAAVFGVWLAEAAYLPVDPEHPRARVAHVLADSDARVVLADPALAPGFASALTEGRTVLPLAPVTEAAPAGRTPRAPAPAPSACAYLIYTSGSTGRPKGTLITHRGLANLVRHFVAELDVTTEDAMLWMTSFAFDMSKPELYLPLAAGGRVVVGPDEVKVDGAALRALIERHGVTLLQATPTTWRLVLDQVADLLRGRRVMFGGEPAPPPLVRRLIATGCGLHHCYGPTETTVWSTSMALSAEDGWHVRVGRPIRNTRVMVVDPDGCELPAGESGEVWIAGDGVALGYHGRPELTAERFGSHPAYGRFYRTGDIGRWCTDGTLELLGRGDRQIKLRGNRIELGDIEAVLAAHPRVRAAAVLAVGDLSADAALVAFVEAADRPGFVDELWEHARAELPRAMVPTEFVVLDALPVNANQKVDYLDLAERARRVAPGEGAAGRPDADPGANSGADPGVSTGADADLVAELVGMWRRLLNRDDLGADSNFFVNGGHSLLAALLTQQVEQRTGSTLSLADVFTNPTPVRLARVLSSAQLRPDPRG
ncbi:non-ribosomal peptide synthetase [Sphaerimonospora sp. CA-214678]|uniref:non-ribosomal peptide synthetase n=1 Tax=Sphaerimonospora sp. CA-214678 TaxID=3240029 RepID=UPI003D8FF613